jgi:hypothetical protein
MRQKNYFGSAKERKFEDGVLRVDACFARHSLPRKYQYRTWQEDLPSSSFGRSALREEYCLQRDVHRLISAGLTPQGHEGLEEFVERYRDVLGEEVF